MLNDMGGKTMKQKVYHGTTGIVENPSANYDYIEGGIANDRVIDTVNLYISGLMSADVALARYASTQ